VINRLRGLPGRLAHKFFESDRRLQLEMVRPSSVPAAVPALCSGYSARPFRAGDERQCDDLLHLAFEDTRRFAEILERALDGGYFVVEHMASGELAASCVAMRGGSPRHPEAGELGWLVTDPSHTGKRLGTTVSALVTNRLAAQGYARPFLATEDFRTAAISIYLKLGWRPFLYDEQMEPRWRKVFAELGREFEPSLACSD
jgi:mycothiol synthase